ncbi:MAG: hypothetical protein QM831_39780 [Kofleriaceae bacterium]
MKWLLLLLAASTAYADDPRLKVTHEPVARHLRMRPKKIGAATSSQATPPPPVVPPPSPTAALADEPAQVRDLQQRVSARVDLGYVVDGTSITGPARPINDEFNHIRAYGFGEGYLSTHGYAFESLSTYFAGRFLLANQSLTYTPTDMTMKVRESPPIATWFERSVFEPRSAWAEVKNFTDDPTWSPLRIRGGEQYVYGPWVLHFYGANAAWDGKLVKANIYGGSQVPDYTADPSLPESREGIFGGAIRFDLRDLQQKIPITLAAEGVKLSSGTNADSSTHAQVELDWRPSKDVALIAQARSLEGKFVNEHAQLRLRYHEVTNLVVDFTHQASDDWLWDPTVLDPDPIAARRYLDLGPVLPRVNGSIRAGTLIAENIDFYARGAAAADLSSNTTRDTYSPTYIEGGGAVEVRVRRTVALGISGLGRWYDTDDPVDAELVDTPGVADPIPTSASSQMGERSFGEFGATARMTLGARKFSLLIEAYGRRTRYALTYCALDAGATDCRSAADTGIPTIQYRGGGRAQIDAWIGNNLRLFASYDLSTTLDFTNNITGYKSLRLVMEGVY